jgi:hypothetical protein
MSSGTLFNPSKETHAVIPATGRVDAYTKLATRRVRMVCTGSLPLPKIGVTVALPIHSLRKRRTLLETQVRFHQARYCPLFARLPSNSLGQQSALHDRLSRIWTHRFQRQRPQRRNPKQTRHRLRPGPGIFLLEALPHRDSSTTRHGSESRHLLLQAHQVRFPWTGRASVGTVLCCGAKRGRSLGKPWS